MRVHQKLWEMSLLVGKVSRNDKKDFAESRWLVNGSESQHFTWNWEILIIIELTFDYLSVRLWLSSLTSPMWNTFEMAKKFQDLFEKKCDSFESFIYPVVNLTLVCNNTSIISTLSEVTQWQFESSPLYRFALSSLFPSSISICTVVFITADTQNEERRRAKIRSRFVMC